MLKDSARYPGILEVKRASSPAGGQRGMILFLEQILNYIGESWAFQAGFP